MKPMLACNLQPDQVIFPCLVSPKIDGIRALVTNDGFFSRKLKKLPNAHLQTLLKNLNKDLLGCDGEITAGHNSDYNYIQSKVMSVKTYSDIWVYHIFDIYDLDPEQDYIDRYYKLKELWENGSNQAIDESGTLIIKLVPQIYVNNLNELLSTQEYFLNLGYEGIMVRQEQGKYKFGRSTTKQQFLGKIKNFEDAEGKLVGMTQFMENLSDSFYNELSESEKSRYQDQLMPLPKVGSLVLEHPSMGKIHVGTGLSDHMRERIWEYQDQFKGLDVKFKFFDTTPNNKPRFPVFLGFRNSEID